MKEIPLTQGQVALVDDVDAARLLQWKWHINCQGYAARTVRLKNNKSRKVFMHHEVVGRPPGMETDHVNGHRLDNRRSNLRHCTSQCNKYNARLRSDNTLGFKGVKRRVDGRYYIARISVNGKRIMIGSFFETPVAAALAYNDAAIKYHGEFAYLNEIPAEEAA